MPKGQAEASVLERQRDPEAMAQVMIVVIVVMIEIEMVGVQVVVVEAWEQLDVTGHACREEATTTTTMMEMTITLSPFGRGGDVHVVGETETITRGVDAALD